MINTDNEKHFAVSDNGLVITFSNGWWLDASFGPGAYCNNRYELDRDNLPELMECENCETIIQDNLGHDHTFEIGELLNISTTGGDKVCAVMPYLKFEDWLRVFDYVRNQKRLE